MSRTSRKPISRRRAAALKFLSTISLDGNGSVVKAASSEYYREPEEEKESHIKSVLVKNEYDTDPKRKTFSEDVITAKLYEMDFSKSYAPFRERFVQFPCIVGIMLAH